MRRATYLPGNRRTTCPTRAVWVDTETVPVPEAPNLMRHELVFGWACFSRRHRGFQWTPPQWERFQTPGGFWDWMLPHCAKRTALYVFAHNAAYDLTVLQSWTELPARGFSLSHAVLDSPPFMATWKRDRQTIRIVCSLNLWKVKLAKLGDVVGLPKLEMPEEWADQARGDDYCIRDVEILHRMFMKWWAWLRENDMGSAANTLASQAFTTYRHRFLDYPLFIDANPKALGLARAGYSGGRVECLSIGKVPPSCKLLDVRSMYPWVMESEEYPTKLLGVYGWPSVSEVRKWLETRCVVARVVVETETPCYPCRVPGYLLFPVGRFETVLCGPELEQGLARGDVTRLVQAAVYERAPIFRSWVREMYPRRLAYAAEGDKFGVEVVKLLLNSLYGKFGQLGWKTEIRADVPYTGVGSWTEIDADTGLVHRVRALGGTVMVETQIGESRHSHPAIAAYVTAWARFRLWGLIQTAGIDSVHYCDTDSLLVDASGLERLAGLIGGDALGRLKIEPRTIEYIHGPKDYVLDGGKRKAKGVKDSAVWVGENQVEQEQWLGPKGLILRDHLHAPLIRREVRTLARLYRKGVVLSTGRTRPWQLPAEWDAWNGPEFRRRT